jgi:hypothetical protein
MGKGEVRKYDHVDLIEPRLLQNIVVVLSLLGVTSTVLFHAFLNARLLEACGSDPGPKPGGVEAPTSTTHCSGRRKSWFGGSLLARVAMLYVASRLFITLATVYLPLYIEETAVGGRQALATVPLASYTASFIAALLLKYMNRSCGTKVRLSIRFSILDLCRLFRVVLFSDFAERRSLLSTGRELRG